MADQQTDQPALTPQQPAQQQAPKPKHTHAGFWLLGAVLAVLVLALVGVAIFLFRGQTEVEGSRAELENRVIALEDDLEAEMQAAEDAQTALEELEMSIPPFVYTEFDATTGFSLGLRVVNRSTGEETLLSIEDAPFEGNVALYAIPQVNYQGRIFVTRGPVDGDVPGVVVHGYDMETGEFTALDLNVSFTEDTISPDQNHVVTFNEFLTGNGEFTDRDVLVFNLSDNEAVSVGELGVNEEPDQTDPASRFAGLRDYNVRWTSRDCFELDVYNISFDAETGERITSFDESRNYCIE